MKKLHGKMSVAQGCQAIVRHCLKQARAHESGVMKGSDPESVHDMRVGLRRLATAIDLFDPVFPFPPSLQAELDWIRQELGSARDWEVLVHDTLPKAIRPNPDQDGLDRLQQESASVALSKRKKAAFAVGSSRYRKFIRDMDEWSERIGSELPQLPADRGKAAANLKSFAASTLVRRHRKLKRRIRDLHLEDAPARHRVRIAAKKARYAAEFFSPLYPRAKTRKYVASLTDMQDVLGGMNDFSVTRELMRQLREKNAALAYAAGFLEGCLHAGAQDDLKALAKRFAAFHKLEAPGAG